MGLTPERYVEIDAELQELRARLTVLAQELMLASADDETLEFSVSGLEFATGHMVYIQQMLKYAQQKSQAQRRRSNTGKQ